MKNIKINIPKNANALIHTLQDNGYEAFVVGGSVRDSILARPVHDWDICTSATPDEMLEVFKGKKIIETGIKHGTVTVVMDGVGYEITTYRIDGEYSDGRRPDEVIFTKSLQEDLSRRDFTINAMAYNDETGLIDPFFGLADLRTGCIRCVGDAKERFNEDALRILRAVRFACQLGFNIDLQITHFFNTCDIKEKLKPVSAERIYSELCKMIMEKDFATYLCNYPQVFGAFIPELWDIADFEQNNPYHVYDVFMHTAYALKYCQSDDLCTRLAVLFHDFGKPQCYSVDENGIGHFHGHGDASSKITDEILRRLHVDNETRRIVGELVLYHDVPFETTEKCVKRWLNRIGEEQFRRLLDIRFADIAAQNPEYFKERFEKIEEMRKLLKVVLEKEACFSLKDLAVNGKDLIAIGYKPGKTLGEVLNMLLEGVIEDKYKNEKESLLKVADLFLAMNGGKS